MHHREMTLASEKRQEGLNMVLRFLMTLPTAPSPDRIDAVTRAVTGFFELLSMEGWQRDDLSALVVDLRIETGLELDAALVDSVQPR